MPDPVQRFVLSQTLWTIVAAPLLGFAWQLAGGLRRTGGARRDAWARGIGVGSVAISTIATAAHVVGIATPEGGIYQHIGWGDAAGPLAAGFDLSLDRFS